VSAEPRSGHDLTAFVVPAHLARPAARAVDLFVSHTRSVNAEYTWLIVDTAVRAWLPPTADPTSAPLTAHPTPSPSSPADLTQGFAMAVDLAAQFVGRHDDGLPVAADLLLVADAQCRLDALDADHLATDGLVQAGIVLHRHATPLPMGMLRRDADSLDTLGWEWLLLRIRQCANRQPDPMLG